MLHMNELSQILKRRLEVSPLPGSAVQLTMAPVTRLRELSRPPQQTPRESAVLATFVEENGVISILLIKRTKDNGVHSRQVAFPGGQREISDTTLADTAIRETFEEIHITPQRISLIGALTPLYIPPSNFNVFPYLAMATGPVEAVSNSEVEKVIKVPLRELLDRNNRTEREIGHRTGKALVPCFTLGGEIVWGATAMMLAEIVDLLMSVLPTKD